MYSQEFGFRPSKSTQKHAREREELARSMKNDRMEAQSQEPPACKHGHKDDEHGFAAPKDIKISNDNIILTALIVFLLSDSAKNDLLLVGILIYLLLN
ncbi:MAG: hypothetical protein PUB08_04155 [Firmicutes bacterium]|nr:hypothetical protein [Bacillota bacterium]